MVTWNREEVQTLVHHRGKGPCVSVYLPPSTGGKNGKQNQIRFKNLLAQAEKQLAFSSLRPFQQEELLQPAYRLLNESIFWSNLDKGLALFLSPDLFRYYEAPVQFEELAVVANSFHLKPLLSLLIDEQSFYILAISQKDARLLKGTQDSVQEIDMSQTIEKFREEFEEETPEQYLQFHTRTPLKPHERPAVFFGHGGEIERAQKERLLKYFRFLDREICGMLEENNPLVLACVDYLFPLYAEASRYPCLLQENIRGNPENISAEKLRDRGWKIVKPYFQKRREEAFKRYQNFKGTSRASNNIEDIVPAAFHGRVDTLFVAVKTHCWGKYNAEDDSVQLSETPGPGDEDLLDTSAVQTYLHKGTVFALNSGDMPNTEPIAAVFRW